MNILNALLLAILACQARYALAMDPPPLHGNDKSSSGYSWTIPAPDSENLSFSPELVAGFQERLSGQKGSLISWRNRGLPAEGSPRVLVLLIDFDEYPARPVDTPAVMRDRIFGKGGAFPYESLSAFYRRSSHGKLNITGDVLGWYRAGRRADVEVTREGREALIKKALLSYSDRDLAQYDNNGDGTIDYCVVIWTGPVGEWATFWWAMATSFSDKNFTAGGVTPGYYSWQGIAADWDDPDSGFKIRTLVHETGHALGLPDYYDYKPSQGPGGGLGHFDIMDANQYDHNCFSKMMLGWVEPKVADLAGLYKLRPAEDSGECIMLLPPGREKDPFGEFFLVENRRKAGNDTERSFRGGGLVIWHVDARLNPEKTNFSYNNSTTEHKLLKILEADGLEELERGQSKAIGPQDFYLNGRSLGPDTLPSSRNYDGSDTRLRLTSKGGEVSAEFLLEQR